MTRYAKNTSVSISKSRGEIDGLLRRWGAKQLQWSDDLVRGMAMLRFIWEYDGRPFAARFVVKVPTEETLRAESLDGRSGKFSKRKYEEACQRVGMVEHRELTLLLKAIFVAIEAGIITAEQVFLPFLEDGRGSTMSDILLPQISKVIGPRLDASKLLPE